MEARASFFTQNYTNNIPEWKNDTLHQKSSQRLNPGKKNTTYHDEDSEKEAHTSWTGNLLEVVVTLSFTTVARSVNTITSFKWQEKNAGKGKNVGFFLKINLHNILVIIKKSPCIGQHILHRTIEWQKNAGEETKCG